MLDKIDVRVIISEHVRTLIHVKTKRILKADLALFFGLPLALAVAAAAFADGMSPALVNVMATVHAILSGLMFNLLVVIYEAQDRARRAGGEAARDKRMRLLSETYRNVSFLILTSICALVALLVVVFLDGGTCGKVASGIVYFLSGVFVLTLLMVLKRVHTLLDEDLAPQTGGQTGPTS